MSRPSALAGPGQLGLALPEPAVVLPGLVARSPWRPPEELPSLRGVRRIGLDTETYDPDLRDHGPGFRRGAYPVGISIAIEDGPSYYLPTDHAGGGNLDRDLVMRWAREELGGYTGEVVGANLGYDLDGLATCWDVHLDNVSAFHDVLVAEPLLDENLPPGSYNLDALARRYLGEGKSEDLLREGAARLGAKTGPEAKRVLWRLPAALVGPYAEADAELPLHIFELQHEQLAEEELLPLYEVERQLVPILVAMRRRGVRINVAKAEALRVTLCRKRDEFVARLKHLAGPQAELREPLSLVPALLERGLPVPRTAPSKTFPAGQYSVAKPFLERYASDELVLALLAGRKLDTMVNTFIDSQILGYNINGRVHPTFNQLKGDDGGTIGRFSGSHPNTQFIPSRESDWQDDADLGELAPLIRGLFEPEEDEQWQRDDASQIEYRYLAHFAVGQGAEEAREVYRSDPKTDFHKMCANMLGADPEDKVRRKRVKNTNFCKVYGGGTAKLAATFGCSLEEAEAFSKEYESKLPFVAATYDAAMKWADRRGYVTTILGGKQRFPFWEPRGNRDRSGRVPALRREEALERYGARIQRAWTYTALNKKLQISAAHGLKKGMVDIYNAGVCQTLGPFLVTVHDELGYSVPPTREGDEAGREATRLMERAVELRVPVLVESDRGPDWGSVS